MASTPPRKARITASSSPSPKPSPGPCPYKGADVKVPGQIFKMPDVDHYVGTIKGWNNRNTDQLWVRFDDGSQYWFPLEDVLKWMAGDTAAAAPSPAGRDPDTPLSNNKQDAGLRMRNTTGSDSSARKPRRQPKTIRARTADVWTDENEQQQEEDTAQQQQAGTASPPLLSSNAAGMVFGVVLLLVVMLVAITALKGAAHDLEDWIDSANELYSGVRAKFRVRQ